MTKRLVSFSGGKDSTAMLIRMIELNIEIDKIIFADTGLEFPELWKIAKWWDIENMRITGYNIIPDYPLIGFEKQWLNGKMPKRQAKYDCWDGCESVKKAFINNQCKLFEDE